MRGKHSKFLIMLLIFTMFLLVFSTSVFAEETPSIEIPVTIKLSGTPPTDDENYNIIFKADNPNYPMPKGSENGIYNLIITGEDTVKLPEIQFSSLGIYTYTIYQLQGTNELASYDDTKYNLVVYVTNAEGGRGLETTVLLFLVGEMEKLDGIIFENAYEKEPAPPVHDKSDHPASKPDVPQTSDDTVIWPYVGLFISGAAMLVLLGVTVRKRKIEE